MKKKINEKVDLVMNTKKTAEEFHIEFLKMDLEHKKEVYKDYLQVLVKYDIPTVALSAIRAEKFYHEQLMRISEKIKDDGKSFMDFLFGKPNLNEEERIKEDIEYYNNCIKIVENTISMFQEDIKLKIAEDAVSYMKSWFTLMEQKRDFEKEKKE
jgi:hypothetical protein